MVGMDLCEGEENCWAHGWLQENFRLSAHMSTELADASRLEGPLTEILTPESFSDRVVDMSLTAWSVPAFLLLLILAHELYARKNKPLFANHEKANTAPLQLVFLAIWMSAFLSGSLVVPLSLDFSVAMGQSATMSGFFLSGGIIGTVVGIIVGKMCISEVDYNQAKTRRLMLFSMFGVIACLFIEICMLMSTVHSAMAMKRTVFFLTIGLGQVSAFCGSMPMVPMMVMWGNVTPTEHKTFWMIMTQCARNAGFLLGPGIFALISLAVKQGQDVAPACLLAWMYWGNICLTLLQLLFASLVLPTILAPAPDSAASSSPSSASASSGGLEVSVAELKPAQRQRVVWNMIWYAFERPFSIAGIEVATIMLLEVSFGWPNELCGFAFTVVSGASLIFSALSSVLLSWGALSESKVFFAANIIGVVGVFMLFDFGVLGASSLLIADGLVYGCASVANGIAEGWASSAAMPGTDFSNENYRLRNLIAVNSARFISPIVTRAILDFGGRNFYAAVQLIVVCIGANTVYRTVKLVWDFKREAKEDPKPSDWLVHQLKDSLPSERKGSEDAPETSKEWK